jgi:glycosyltransferase involved in cell wall biosynthesis
VARHPFVSVIIPVRNEERYIESCLRSLLSCAYPPSRWEIIIADGMSADGTRDAIERVRKESRVLITVLDNPRRVTPIGLNLALAQAHGEIIIRVDAHADYGEEYVARCVAVVREIGADNVGGPVITRPGADTPMAHAIALAMAHPFGVGNSAFRTSAAARDADTVPYGCFRAAVFERIGLFDERLWRNQDYELNQRIRRAGGRIYLDPRLTSVYYSRPTLSALLRQAWANGYWNAHTHALHPGSFCLRHALPGAFSLGMLLAAILAVLALSLPLSIWVIALALPVWACCVLYAVLSAGIALRLAWQHELRVLPSLLLVFPAFHFWYGLGVVRGWWHTLLNRYPWSPEDGIPRWENPRDTRLVTQG